LLGGFLADFRLGRQLGLFGLFVVMFGFTFFRAAAGQQSGGQHGADNHFDFHNGSVLVVLMSRTVH
jgi:hypothetical protein